MKHIKEVFACPHCGRVGFLYIAYMGYQRKQKCIYCNKETEFKPLFYKTKIAVFILLSIAVRVVSLKLIRPVSNVPLSLGDYAFLDLVNFFLTSSATALIFIVLFKNRDNVYSDSVTVDDEVNTACTESTDENRSFHFSLKKKCESVLYCDLCGKKMSAKAIILKGWGKEKPFECEHCGNDLQYRYAFFFKRSALSVLFITIFSYVDERFGLRNSFSDLASLLILFASWALCFVGGALLAVATVKNRDEVFMPRGFDVEKADDTGQKGSKQDGQ